MLAPQVAVPAGIFVKVLLVVFFGGIIIFQGL